MVKRYFSFLIKLTICFSVGGTFAPTEALAQTPVVRAVTRMPSTKLERLPKDITPQYPGSNSQENTEGLPEESLTLEEFKEKYKNKLGQRLLKPKAGYSSGFIRPDDVKALCDPDKQAPDNKYASRLRTALSIQLSRRISSKEDVNDVSSDVIKRFIDDCDEIKSTPVYDIFLSFVLPHIRAESGKYRRNSIKEGRQENIDDYCEVIPGEDPRAITFQSYLLTSDSTEHILDGLTPRQRMVATLLLNGFSVEEIKKELGITDVNLRAIVSDAAARVRKFMCEKS